MRLVGFIIRRYHDARSSECHHPLSTTLLKLVYVQLMLLITDILVFRCTVNYYECIENHLIILHTLEEVGYFKIQCGIFPHTERSCTLQVMFIKDVGSIQ